MKRMMLAVLFAVMLGVCARADDEAGELARSIRDAGAVRFNIRNMDIERFTRFMSEVLGEEIVLSSDINRKSYVSVFTAEPVTLGRAREILMTALRNSSFSNDKDTSPEIKAAGKITYFTPILEFCVTPAIPGGDEGSIPAAALDYFLEDTASEMDRVRFRLNRNTEGLEVQWIARAGLLAKMGLNRGDIVLSVNGGELTGMKSLHSVISSLMRHERFDIEIMRGGKRTALRYVVK